MFLQRSPQFLVPDGCTAVWVAGHECRIDGAVHRVCQRPLACRARHSQGRFAFRSSTINSSFPCRSTKLRIRSPSWRTSQFRARPISSSAASVRNRISAICVGHQPDFDQCRRVRQERCNVKHGGFSREPARVHTRCRLLNTRQPLSFCQLLFVETKTHQAP